MHIVIKEKDKIRINRLLDWFLYMVGYTVVFLTVTSFFKSIYIDEKHIIIWSFIIVITTYILNKTVKPILVTLTIPITGLTLGLFYPCINLFILKLVDWLLNYHFELRNLWIALLVAILLSITNMIMEHIISNIITKVKHYE